MKYIQDLSVDLLLGSSGEDPDCMLYGPRSSKRRRGEMEFLQIFFRPLIQSPIKEIAFSLRPTHQFDVSAQSSEHPESDDVLLSYPLPNGYGDFLVQSNGAILFGGNILLYGLSPVEDTLEGARARFDVPDIAIPNAFARPSFVSGLDTVLATYTRQQRVLFFSRERASLCLSGPFGTGVVKEWSDFNEYFSNELILYRRLFNERGELDSRLDSVFS